MSETIRDSILKSLRRITRSIDLHSRELASTFGLTGPQLVCLRVIGQHKSLTPSKLAQEVSLSQATITGIIDRLAARQLVTRDRSATDRRLVSVEITAAGRDLIRAAPYPLQESFLKRLQAESRAEQENMQRTLEKIVRMMDGEKLSAAPVLSSSAAALTPDEIGEASERVSDPLAADASSPGASSEEPT